MKQIYSLIFIILLTSCSKTNTKIGNDPLQDEGVTVNELNMNFVYIKPGTFLMGIPEGYIGHLGGKNPRHKVTINTGFYIQSTEVTQEQWLNVTGYNPSYFNTCGNDCPVENVSWNEIQKFITLLNDLDKNNKYRLPTEAEWEYAARANSSGPYYFGDCLTTFHANFKQWYFNHETMYKCQNGTSIGHPIPVGSLERNGFGLYDMYGNVAEWCQDYWGERPIQHSHVIDPQGPSKGYGRVVRGGSWESLPVNCLSGYSLGALQESKNRNTGFRLIMRKKR